MMRWSCPSSSAREYFEISTNLSFAKVICPFTFVVATIAAWLSAKFVSARSFAERWSARPVEEYFAALAPLEREPLRGKLAHLSEALEDPAFLAEFTRNPRQNALIRNTMTPTVLEGSLKTNVIPDSVELQVDIRTLPGQTGKDVRDELREALGDLWDAVDHKIPQQPPAGE